MGCWDLCGRLRLPQDLHASKSDLDQSCRELSLVVGPARRPGMDTRMCVHAARLVANCCKVNPLLLTAACQKIHNRRLGRAAYRPANECLAAPLPLARRTPPSRLARGRPQVGHGRRRLRGRLSHVDSVASSRGGEAHIGVGVPRWCLQLRCRHASAGHPWLQIPRSGTVGEQQGRCGPPRVEGRSLAGCHAMCIVLVPLHACACSGVAWFCGRLAGCTCTWPSKR